MDYDCEESHNLIGGKGMKRLTKISMVITILMLILIVAGCKPKKTFNVSTFDKNEKQMKRDVLEPFGKDNDLQVKAQFGKGTKRIKQTSDDDVIELTQNDAITLNKAGKLRKIDFKRLKNFNHLSSEQRKLAKETNSLPYSLDTFALLYDPKKVNYIESAIQIWDPTVVKRPAIPDIATDYGPALIQAANDYGRYNSSESFVGTGIDQHGQRALSSLKGISANVKTYKTTQELSSLFKNGQIDAALVGNSAVSEVMADNPKLRYLYATWYNDSDATYKMVSILKDSKNVDEAYKYLDYRISKSVQTKVAAKKSLNEAPVNSSVKVKHNKYLANINFGHNAITPDFSEMNHELTAWEREWNEILK